MSSRNPKGAAALLNIRARALRRALPPAIDGDDTGVHRARVASRRLREAIPVLAAGGKGTKQKKTSRKIRQVTRALGTVRELDVTLGLIDDFAESPDLSRPALQDVRLHVAAARDNRRQHMLSRLAAVDLAKLDRRLLRAATAAAERPHAWRDALGARLVQRAKALSAAVEGAGQLYATEQLHRVRIAAKKLRYGLELAADSGIATAAPLVRHLKRAQEILGNLHDLQVLQTHVAAVQANAPGQAAPHEGLAAIAGHIEERCRLLHGRYVKTIPTLMQVTAAVRSDVVPRLASATRPLKMAMRRSSRVAGGAR